MGDNKPCIHFKSMSLKKLNYMLGSTTHVIEDIDFMG